MHRRERLGVLGVFVLFLVCGAAQASWAVQLPWFRVRMSLSDAVTGALALTLSVSCCIGLSVGTRVLRRARPERVVVVGLSATLVGAMLLQVTSLTLSLGVLLAALLVLGVGIGLSDVALNVVGTRLERWTERVLMPILHAGFSFGLLCCALLALLGASMPASARGAAVLAMCAVGGIGGVALLRGVPLPSSPDWEQRGARASGASPFRRTVVLSLGVVLALAAAAEGIGDTWVPVLAARAPHPETPTSTAYVLFTAAVCGSRLAVHGLSARWSRMLLLRVALVVALVGVGLLTTDDTLLPLAAVLWGAGTGVAFPLLISEAGARSGGAATIVTAVTSAGYAGLLVGPSGVGLVAEALGVPAIARTCIVLLIGGVVLATVALRDEATVPRDEATTALLDNASGTDAVTVMSVRRHRVVGRTRGGALGDRRSAADRRRAQVR